MMLFPSIYPETFSYVVHELMAMDLPIAAFNIGAPAEKLRHYAHGLLLFSRQPEDILADLIQFHHVLLHKV